MQFTRLYLLFQKLPAQQGQVLQGNRILASEVDVDLHGEVLARPIRGGPLKGKQAEISALTESRERELHRVAPSVMTGHLNLRIAEGCYHRDSPRRRCSPPRGEPERPPPPCAFGRASFTLRARPS